MTGVQTCALPILVSIEDDLIRVGIESLPVGFKLSAVAPCFVSFWAFAAIRVDPSNKAKKILFIFSMVLYVNVTKI